MRITRTLSALLCCALIGLSTGALRAQGKAEGKTIGVNGIDLYYEEHGSGEPLVLLHGFTGSRQAWNSYHIDSLAAHYRLIIPDMRGHGGSTNPSGIFTHRQSALDIYALLDSLRIDRFRSIGSSSGAMTLLHMATQQPARVEAMVLISGTTYFPEQARAIMRSRNPDSLSERDLERMRREHRHGDEQIRSLVRQFNNFKDSYEDMNFTPPLLSTIRARTLIIHGDRDQFFPVEIPVQMYESIPHSYLWIVPNGGHGPLGADLRLFFVRTTLDFLGGKWEKNR